MLNSIEVLWFTHVNGRVQFRALFRQFTNIFCYAQKRCARGDTAPLTSLELFINANFYSQHPCFLSAVNDHHADEP